MTRLPSPWPPAAGNALWIAGAMVGSRLLIAFGVAVLAVYVLRWFVPAAGLGRRP